MGRMGQERHDVRQRDAKGDRAGKMEVYKLKGSSPASTAGEHRKRTLSSYWRPIIFSVLTMAFLWKFFAVGLGFAASVSSLSTRTGRHSTPTVRVKNGTYSGIHSPQYDQDFFLGIPYAQVCGLASSCEL